MGSDDSRFKFQTMAEILMKSVQSEAVVTLRIFFRVFLNKHKLHNLIKRKFYILTTTTIKKHANT